MEKIGGVILNYDYYSGIDDYSDGEIEDQLLEIVKKYPEEEFDNLIRRKKNWPITYHLSRKRQNLIEWMQWKQSANVLEIGAGCGAVTGILSERCNEVTCIELSKKRSLINAYRHKHYHNIEIIVGNFEEIENLPVKYDYVTLIGVLEYSQLYIRSGNPYVDLIKLAGGYLRNEGKMILAIENRFGLKYWAGCQEDHLDKYYVGIEGYREGDAVKTFTKSELKHIFQQAGYETVSFYYPYPDYKFTECIYSDAYLPKRGELSYNTRNIDKQRLMTFQENKVYDSLIKEGLFAQFSNSFLCVLEKGKK